ncbi:jacalin-like lectin [Nonomuraea sp. NPDC049480]|uniref:jacalin-like lectin n=1 Tax=Nonomuraea sp. NPDC049480 TaxID=3364353 RepID=UPI0037A88D56
MSVTASVRRPVVLLVLALLLAVVPANAAAAAGSGANGAFSVLTYNVAGLPEPLSSGNPATNTPLIGARLGPYDVVHVQEDFNYHAALYAADTHPHRTPTSGGVPFGDGLNTLSGFPYSDFQRVKWNQCNGTDCLTPKGFTFSRIRFAEGVYVDFYNVHANAGSESADLAARRANITQLSQFIQAYSAGQAVVVMGDTNTRYTRTGDNIRTLVDDNGLKDAWVQAVRGGVPPAAGDPALVCDPANVTDDCEVVDKIFYRGNRFVRLDLLGYHNENARFLDGAGAPLSDHYPHLARFSWSLDSGIRMSEQFGGPHGTPFTDVAALPAATQVRRLLVRAGSRVDQVGIEYGTGRTLTHGGTGGTARSLDLGAGEHLTQLTLWSGQRNGHTRIFALTARTNLGRTLSVGTQTSTQATFTAPSGWKISGFHGRSGDEVDKLGVIYTPI